MCLVSEITKTVTDTLFVPVTFHQSKAALSFRITRDCKHVDVLRKRCTCSPEEEDMKEEEEEERRSSRKKIR